MAHRDRFVEAPLLLRLETSSGLSLQRSCVSCCSPRIIGGSPLESSLTRSEFCLSGANRRAFARCELSAFDQLGLSVEGLVHRAPPNWGVGHVGNRDLFRIFQVLPEDSSPTLWQAERAAYRLWRGSSA